MRTVVYKKGNRQVIQEGNESFESQDYSTLEGAKRSLYIEPTTEENNEMIAEFMGHENPQSWEDDLYSSDWNWLMDVVEKIEDLNYSVEINKQEDGDYQCLVTKSSIVSSEFSDIKINAVYNACVKFIRWYNNQNK